MGEFFHYFTNGVGDGIFYLVLLGAAIFLHTCAKYIAEKEKSSWWGCLLWGFIIVMILTFFAWTSDGCYEAEWGFDDTCIGRGRLERITHAGKMFIVYVALVGTGIYEGWKKR